MTALAQRVMTWFEWSQKYIFWIIMKKWTSLLMNSMIIICLGPDSHVILCGHILTL
jgi:hypothetical protein